MAEQYLYPKYGNQVQKDCHDRSYQGVQKKRIRVCSFCSRVIPKMYSTFQDRKKHVEITHPTCLGAGDEDPLFVEG